LGQITSENIFRLFKKYGLILITFELITRFGLTYFISFYHRTFPVEDLSTLNDLNSTITATTFLLCDLVIGLIILSDLDRNKTLTWIIFALTLLNPWMSVIFLLLWKVVELKTTDKEQ
jgi:hypothetical protein